MSVVAPVEIGGRLIGEGHACFIIAEAGVNHNGSIALAHELIDAAATAGADAVKFQTFSADALTTAQAAKAPYQRRTTDPAESQHEMLRRLELSPQAHEGLVEHCRRAGVMFLSTPFDERSADLLERLDVPAFKIPSGEITNTPLLRHIAAKRRPVIMSTGMATLDEVAVAVDCVRVMEPRIVLLQCVSAYPSPPGDSNLRAMQTLRDRFLVPTGYSDHTEGEAVTLAAVALGASIVEKHFTLDRALSGPDHAVSLDPAELAALVRHARDIEAALGSGIKQPTAAERQNLVFARRSLVAGCDLPAGTVLRPEHIHVRRPATGLPPAMFDQIVGRRVTQALSKGTPLCEEVLA